jgi:hypothetical protein
MKTQNYTRESNGKFVFPQTSRSAAKTKFKRMLTGAGFFGMNSFTIGFANWTLNEDTIECYTTYHAESTVLEMYTSNCKRY